MRSWVSPRSATTSPSTLVRDLGGKIALMNVFSRSEYSTMPQASAIRSGGRSKAVKSGSRIAVKIWRARSARKLVKSTPSPSRIPA